MWGFKKGLYRFRHLFIMIWTVIPLTFNGLSAVTELTGIVDKGWPTYLDKYEINLFSKVSWTNYDKIKEKQDIYYHCFIAWGVFR